MTIINEKSDEKSELIKIFDTDFMYIQGKILAEKFPAFVQELIATNGRNKVEEWIENYRKKEN